MGIAAAVHTHVYITYCSMEGQYGAMASLLRCRAGWSLTGKKKRSGTSFPNKACGHSMCSTMVGGG